jgi:putative NIF3 family GTP cyclohydrolase 1 type 2
MNLTIQQTIDRILQDIPGSPFSQTVDVVKTGDAGQKLTGIVTTFLASQAVIEKAIMLGCNLIIAHEPVFYNHLDRTDWLESSPVYQAKRRLLDVAGIVVWRFHDYWHSLQPDGIYTGLLQKLGWEQVPRPQANSPLFTIPQTTVEELAHFLKAKLGASGVRVVGSLDMPCSKVGFLVGAIGGENTIKFATEFSDLDVLVCGEGGGEWETCEYVRDAITQGRKLALILVGHAASEEPGMEYLMEWLKARFPETPITHVPLGEPFAFL